MPQGVVLGGAVAAALPLLILCLIAFILARRKLAAHSRARTYLYFALVLLALRAVNSAYDTLFVRGGRGLSGAAAVDFAQRLVVINLIHFVTLFGGIVLLIMAALADRGSKQET